MPELPEVETTRLGIEPLILGLPVTGVQIRESRLRWPVPGDLQMHLPGQRVLSVGRRAKYLLFDFDHGTLLLHLGMSGSLRIVDPETPAGTHDHVEIGFPGSCLRLRDPRRFGSLHWTTAAAAHPLLVNLGPEPLSEAFDGDYLHARSRGRAVAVKNLLMNSQVVAGIGNIYASEALHLAGIHPQRAAGRISLGRCHVLAASIKQVLIEALADGGTTLRDFARADGRPGYFRQSLRVYERDGELCRCAAGTVRRTLTGQRSTYYCPACQR